MTLNKAISLLDGKIHACCTEDRELSSGYCGDFLSFVMGKAPSGCLWFTIMNNQNVAAVASLTEVGLIILCDDVQPDEFLAKKVSSVGLDLIVTKYPVFEAVKKSGL